MTWRLCFSNAASTRVMLTQPPAGYNRSRCEWHDGPTQPLLRRCMHASEDSDSKHCDDAGRQTWGTWMMSRPAVSSPCGTRGLHRVLCHQLAINLTSIVTHGR
jgi:hypothetical protein